MEIGSLLRNVLCGAGVFVAFCIWLAAAIYIITPGLAASADLDKKGCEGR